MTGPPAAVVFDCDGVLVDSEPHSVAAWVTVLAHLRHPAGREDVERCTGLGFAPTWAALDAIAPLPPPEVVWRLLIAVLGYRFIDPGLRTFFDAMTLLEACAEASIPVAVVSASPRERLDLTLRRVGLESRFAVSVSGDDVAAGKPAPDPFLAAAAALGVDPESCLAVEDSPAGAASAAASGMRVVAVLRRPDERDALEATGAEVVEALGPSLLG